MAVIVDLCRLLSRYLEICGLLKERKLCETYVKRIYLVKLEDRNYENVDQ